VRPFSDTRANIGRGILAGRVLVKRSLLLVWGVFILKGSFVGGPS
jgi:hypothetical protein